MQEMIMPVKSRIKVLLAERNLDRIRAGEKPISVRGLSEATGITHSALVKLVNGKSGMISFETLDKLMQFFGTKDLNAILEYVPPEGRQPDAPASATDWEERRTRTLPDPDSE